MFYGVAENVLFSKNFTYMYLYPGEYDVQSFGKQIQTW